MGDESLADMSRIPNSTMLKLDAPGWVGTVGGTVHLQCRYQVLNENLLDLTHLTFLHRGSIGDEMLASAEPHVTETPAGLEIVRHVKSAQMDHLPVGKAIGIKGPIDRTMRQQFFPPSLHSTGSDYDSAAADGSEPGKHFGAARFLHGVTPETPTTTLYFWAFARNFRLDPEFTKTFHAMVSIAVTEDVDALQSIEALLDDRLVEPVERISTRADMGALRGRRMVGVQIENETAARGLPERSATSGDDLAVDLHS